MAFEHIQVDGNDGTGKSTLVRLLAAYGIEAADRGEMTKASDDPSVKPRDDVVFYFFCIFLDTIVLLIDKKQPLINEKKSGLLRR